MCSGIGTEKHNSINQMEMTHNSTVHTKPEVATEVKRDLFNVLVVDDELAIRKSCQEVAETLGHQVYTAENAAVAYRVLETHAVDIVLLDIKLPGINGLEVMREVRQRRPEVIIIIITAYASIPTAVQAMRNGAYEYMTNPFNLEELKMLLERAGSQVKMTAENRLLREGLKTHHGFGGIIGRTPEMEKMYHIIAKVAQSSQSVLILGESGTGKEMVARSIHFNGPHPEAPFIPVDCGSLVPTLIESELFGYVKSAFTGAQRSKEGLLQIAAGGTVFLDEISEMPLDLQSKLKRAIQEKKIKPVGSTKRVPINVRILAATNRDLESAVANGTFRKDLYIFLNMVNLRIPQLCDRRADIPLLAEHFLDRLNRSTGISRSLSDEAIQVMSAYDWPGNVRELENCIERAAALSSGRVLNVADMPSQMQDILLHNEAASVVPCDIVPIAELEKRAIMSALTQVNGDKLRAASLLGIGKTTLYRKLKEYGSAF